MANASLVITWGNSVPGRESQSLELFMGILQKYTGLQAEGKIQGHSAHLATSGNSNNLAGAMIIEGEITQLRDLIDSDWYRDMIIKARHLVDNINEVHCVTGDAIQGNIERVVKARKELGIT
ncbi:MAG: hypothetical protein WCF10_16935 [Polyangiales bacterium]